MDASITHLYHGGTRRHFENALGAGVTIEEIVATLDVVSSLGMQSPELALPILAEECARAGVK